MGAPGKEEEEDWLPLLQNLNSFERHVKEEPAPHNHEKHTDWTRTIVTGIVVVLYFIMLVGSFFFVHWHNKMITDLILKNPTDFSVLQSQILCIKDVIILITGSLGSAVGFVIGYYFKSEDAKKSSIG